MVHRGRSPALSENEFDIGSALLGGDAVSDDEVSRDTPQAQNPQGIHLDLMADDSGSDDERIIAQQQVASNRKSSNIKGRSVKKGGGFQAMGLNPNLLKAITRKGFSVPTPIQRKTIPLLLNDKDVVGMARTGSGKTAAFVIPMIERLKVHSTKVGSRALILSPSRELALQTLQVVKELGRGTDLRCILLVGGDSLEEQFSSMSNNPDIIIATPGRFVHLKVEMQLDLSSIKYVVFDEADRLFEMGFAPQLTEILHALPASRQTLLFSATLPKSLVEFARAGLQDPVLIRLDAESKISPDLQSVFFSVKSSEKEGALLHILQDVIKVPSISQKQLSRATGANASKKRKRDEGDTGKGSKAAGNPYSTIVFAATKHHVEYIAQLLRMAGYAVSYIYGTLDQTARKTQVQAFRSGETNILVVTDVAARGIDIPVLANVINLDFPSQPKIYVHRVGRTARAGEKGWSYSLVHDADIPYLLDLQLFLSRKLVVGRAAGQNVDFAKDVALGSVRRELLQQCCEWVNIHLERDADLAALRLVASKGEKLYQRTRNSASAESAKRAKSIISGHDWTELHPLFDGAKDNMEVEREQMLAQISKFRPNESIFEIGARRVGRKGQEQAIEAIRSIRSTLEKKKQKSQARSSINPLTATAKENDENDDGKLSDEEMRTVQDMSDASDSELEVTFSNHKQSKENGGPHSFRDTENYMSYTPANVNLAEDRAYGVHSGTNSNFAEAARGATMDLGGDELKKGFGEARSVMRWDKRQKKYVARQNDEDGSKGHRLVRGESGAKIAASFRSGRYDAWRKAHKVRAPRVGEVERKGEGNDVQGKRYRHKTVKAPRAADKFRDDFEKRKKKVADAKERNAGAYGRSELRSVDDVRKERKLKEKRQEKNARPSKKSKR